MQDLRRGMEAQNYIADEETIVTVYLALRLEKPILVTGAPGVGKTELAKVLSAIFGAQLIRLQCYEGLDENKALYEWNYQRQLLHIQAGRAGGEKVQEEDLFTPQYLLERPLLKAIRAEGPTVLLIDEVDKTDEEFEAFLFEVLSDFQVSIPELGTLTARQIPVVVLTSNGERELSDALKRRCVFLYIDYPSREKEMRIIQAKVPGISERLGRQIAGAVYLLRRQLELKKPPAIAETLDWARALLLLGVEGLDAEAVQHTLNLVLKDRNDQEEFQRRMGPAGLVQAVFAGEG